MSGEQCTNLSKNTLLLKNAQQHLNVQSHNLFAGGGSCLNIEGSRLIWIMVAEDWGFRSNFLK